jgi:hypothetical protein
MLMSAAGATAVQRRQRRLGRVWFRVLTWRLNIFDCKPCCLDPEGGKVSSEGWGGSPIKAEHVKLVGMQALLL